MIFHHPVTIHIKGIDREIAPRRVLGKIRAEGNNSPAPVGLDILAKTCDLISAPAHYSGDRTVVYAGR